MDYQYNNANGNGGDYQQANSYQPDYQQHGVPYANQYPPPSPVRGSFQGSATNSMNGQTYDEQIPLKAANEGSGGYPYPSSAAAGAGRKKKGWIWLAVIAAIIVIALAVILPVYFTVIKKDDASDNSDSDSSTGTSSARPSASASASPETPQRLTRGGDGSEITMENGTTFTYRNPFGGFWVQDPEDPFNLDAQCNDYTPPLNTTWRWGVDRVYGVNLGGLFVLEPFISPEIFQRYPGTEDEYDLTAAMREAGTLDEEMEEHYNTFITEQDIAEIAGAGLNWLRVPIGFWAIETYESEPFLERTSWRYFLRIVEWCRKYGLRIYLDLHAAPGSQNGLNHSARLRFQSLLRNDMGIANAERTIYYLRVFAQFISQPEYRNVIPMLGLVNEPESRDTGMDTLKSWYLEAYNVIREATGYGEGNGPYLAVGDGFRSALEWEPLMPGADRFIMDIHPYVAFDEGSRADPLDVPAADGEMGGVWPTVACERWGTYFNDTRRALGVTVGGEFSAAVNDCGFWMRAVGIDSFHPQCDLYNAWEDWSEDMVQGLYNFVLASFDAIGDFFFWTWKIGPTQAGRVETPMWSYKLGLENGWIPRDPRVALGKCAALGVAMAPFDGQFQPHQTGAVAQPTIPADYAATYPWPPLEIDGAQLPIESLPRYTSVGPAITLPVPTYTGAPAEMTQDVDGWTNDADTRGAIGPVPGCNYPDPYVGTYAVLPTGAACGVAA
ncbi:exo-beta-1,3-glucanase [Coprinopsis cinerea okayama7|uniref:glucan 1,3-beta-glucosidase n=1 Tax=Coprinopsis cinerea (strain Okayama-7 / 130 / ATCC MYA-4618 / FGSC 9003) TaxID=240176 RepID=A8P210_COPC7|nr:exo-beta-1,3-glucanase [Coprinopsis cinerea okayama7\|eukprot:XP_001838216.1 exo-beta-1,3-glucanase [Coprinopsis cinerea okayama7\